MSYPSEADAKSAVNSINIDDEKEFQFVGRSKTNADRGKGKEKQFDYFFRYHSNPNDPFSIYEIHFHAASDGDSVDFATATNSLYYWRKGSTQGTLINKWEFHMSGHHALVNKHQRPKIKERIAHYAANYRKKYYFDGERQKEDINKHYTDERERLLEEESQRINEEKEAEEQRYVAQLARGKQLLQDRLYKGEDIGKIYIKPKEKRKSKKRIWQKWEGEDMVAVRAYIESELNQKNKGNAVLVDYGDEQYEQNLFIGPNMERNVYGSYGSVAYDGYDAYMDSGYMGSTLEYDLGVGVVMLLLIMCILWSFLACFGCLCCLFVSDEVDIQSDGENKRESKHVNMRLY